MVKTKATALVICAVLVVAALQEVITSWYSEISGPFSYFSDTLGGGTNSDKIKRGINSYFERPRTKEEATSFLINAGFDCDRPYSTELLRLRTKQVGIPLSSGLFCHYDYGRYFMSYYVIFVELAFDMDSKVIKHEVFWDF